MTKKIRCQSNEKATNVRVRIVKAPLVDTSELKRIVLARAKALVLQF